MFALDSDVCTKQESLVNLIKKIRIFETTILKHEKSEIKDLIQKLDLNQKFEKKLFIQDKEKGFDKKDQ